MGNRTFAAQFEEAIAFAMTGIAELSGEAACIEMRAARAVVVDQAVIGELGTLEIVAAPAVCPSRQTRALRPEGYTDSAGSREY